MDDGTITGWVAEAPRAFAGQTLLTLALPAGLPYARVSGRYFLARCGAQSAAERAEQWQIYLRRPLFCVERTPLIDALAAERAEGHDLWRVAGPAGDDPGDGWLRTLTPGATVNLIGPLGNGFFLAPTTRNLLVVADVQRLAPLIALLHVALDRGGHVTLALRQGAVDGALQAQLPVAVEVQTLQPGGDGWLSALVEPLRWADQLCFALPATTYAPLAAAIRRQRLRLESGFAFALVDADLACGYGACLACVTPLANGGLTRACVHGPVIDLLELAPG